MHAQQRKHRQAVCNPRKVKWPGDHQEQFFGNWTPHVAHSMSLPSNAQAAEPLNHPMKRFFAVLPRDQESTAAPPSLASTSIRYCKADIRGQPASPTRCDVDKKVTT